MRSDVPDPHAPSTLSSSFRASSYVRLNIKHRRTNKEGIPADVIRGDSSCEKWELRLITQQSASPIPNQLTFISDKHVLPPHLRLGHYLSRRTCFSWCVTSAVALVHLSDLVG